MKHKCENCKWFIKWKRQNETTSGYCEIIGWKTFPNYGKKCLKFKSKKFKRKKKYF